MISSSSRTWFVLSHRRQSLKVSGKWMLSILCRQPVINTCTFLMMVVVVLQVSATYSRNFFTFVFRILNLVLIDSCFEIQMLFSCRYAVLALPIHTFTSSSDPQCSSMMLARYVKVYI
ncbi:unnamed protein product [Schistosoma margrebowiei]|uniref:Uncharacterized protein n=1 Tax=Schistosoma margrebowiei TaxID=48269 RepID=A0A3P7Y7N4_9TREM|nr:unnamed protein product [Schistosoma margrebowiei]